MKKITLFVLLIALMSCKTNDTTPTKELIAELEYKIPAKLGEGAFWDYKNDVLYWIDIIGESLHIYSPKDKTDKEIKMPAPIGTVVPSEEENKVIVALNDGVYVVDITTEDITKLTDVEAENKGTRLNDGKCDPNGNLWIGSMDYSQTNPGGGLYKVDASGKTDKMLGNITISNGIVWSKDNKTMYYIDTPTTNIRAYDFDETTNTISNERVVVTIPKEEGFPDGMAIDENDMLWVGLWNGNCIANYNPQTGKLIQKIKVPAHNVTSCAFGGEDLDILYITTASLDMTDAEKKQYPMAGSLFKIKLKTKGVHSAFFKKPVINTIPKDEE
ncbi:SMP-30/gluconolactonase/LRE family protein [Kordia sp.]|uniref:SMP-30/gluconolactonase/LRE family protein n=1 Tax=Kordia sp. TaxID=1965332 RepID=UPI0025B82A74|nr:SMP-30/gluconolactonase/LRE family protein [Kordia sp.]MCH2195764.1 SMP-30/gluconolactonase/LRE family protein [Kordia sp.]